MAASNNDWFGNLITNMIQMILAGLGMYIGWIFVIIGSPEWYYTFVTSFAMMPPMAKSFSKSIN